MKLTVKGKGSVSLGRNSFLASGGQGSVYVKGALAYKVYHDAKTSLSEAKIRELSSIQHPNVIKPLDVLLRGRKPCGYTMRYVRDTHVLCQLFTKAFCKRHNVSQQQKFDLVLNMREMLDAVHKANVLVVDFNEFNVLVDKRFKEAYLIDVDSFQTRSFPAVAIMPSVQDPQAGTHFTVASDWYSFAVISYQALTGIHPFKGKHPTVKGLKERMHANISVLDPHVSVPKACADPRVVLPPVWLDWYRKLFVQGERGPAPTGVQIVSVQVNRILKGTDNLTITLLCKVRESIQKVFVVDTSKLAVLTAKGVDTVNGSASAPLSYGSKYKEVVTVPGALQGPPALVGAYIEMGKLRLEQLEDGKQIPCNVAAEMLLSYNNQLYTKVGGALHRIKLMRVTKGVLVAPQLAANVMPYATTLYDGVALQDMLGMPHATFFPATDRTATVSLPDLKGFKILDAKYERGLLVVSAAQQGCYTVRFYRPSTTGEATPIRVLDDVRDHDINVVVLANGICAFIHEDWLGLFDIQHPQNRKRVVDPSVGQDMRLVAQGTRLLFTRGKEIFQLKTK